MRLSFGFVRGDHIACLYHGWQYDTAGQCRYIPAHPTLDVPQTIKVPIYRVEEKYGIIWTTTLEDAAIPDADPTEITPVRSLYVDRPIDEVFAAFNAAGMTGLGTNAGKVVHGDDVLFVAFQATTGAKTAVHIVLCGSIAVYGGAKQKHYAQWAGGLRFEIEAAQRVAEVA
jgi:hypothetical protein